MANKKRHQIVWQPLQKCPKLKDRKRKAPHFHIEKLEHRVVLTQSGITLESQVWDKRAQNNPKICTEIATKM